MIITVVQSHVGARCEELKKSHFDVRALERDHQSPGVSSTQEFNTTATALKSRCPNETSHHLNSSMVTDKNPGKSGTRLMARGNIHFVCLYDIPQRTLSKGDDRQQP